MLLHVGLILFVSIDQDAKSYFAASYVKFLEAGGAKVVPILSTDSAEDVSKLVLQLNGVLFTGGTEYFNSSSVYYSQVKNILDTLRQYHAENPAKSIPLWFVVCFSNVIFVYTVYRPSTTGARVWASRPLCAPLPRLVPASWAAAMTRTTLR